jgi:hypothetical protein
MSGRTPGVASDIKRLSIFKIAAVTAAVLAYTVLWAHSVATDFSYNAGGWGLSFGLITLPFIIAAPITAGVSSARVYVNFRSRNTPRQNNLAWLALALLHAACFVVMLKIITALHGH